MSDRASWRESVGDAPQAADAAARALDALAALIPHIDADALAAAARWAVELRQRLDVVTHAVTARSAELCALGEGQAAVDLWKRNGGVAGREARRLERRHQVCTGVPALDAAFRSGNVSGDHLDVVGRLSQAVDAELRRELLGRGDELAAAATTRPVDEFEQWCRSLVESLHRQLGRTAGEHDRRANRLRCWRDRLTNQTHLRGVLDAELGARFTTALQAEVEAWRNGQRTSGPGDPAGPVDDQVADREHVAAYALVGLVTATHRSRRSSTPEIVVLTDAQTLACGEHPDTVCELVDGVPIPVDTMRRWACIARLHRVLLGPDGEVLDVGRGARLATAAQRRALRAMYATCAWEGCKVDFVDCEIHHLVPWEQGGPTDLANLVPICVRHHHLVHEGRWRLDLAPDRQLTIIRPEGRVDAVVPPPDCRPRHRRRQRYRSGAPPGPPGALGPPGPSLAHAS